MRPENKREALAYFDSNAVGYEAHVNRGLLKPLRDRERAAMLRHARLDAPGRRMLDVGCGGGFYALEAKRRGMWVHAIDISPKMIERLYGRVDRVELADVEHFESEEPFARVVGAGVLDFVVDPERALTRLCRLVAPGGRLAVLVPREGPGGWIYRLEKFRQRLRVHLYRAEWLEHIARREGLETVALEHPLPTNLAMAFERPR